MHTVAALTGADTYHVNTTLWVTVVLRMVEQLEGISRVSDLWNARRNNGTGHNSIPAGLPV